MAAYSLASRGKRVALIEQGPLLTEEMNAHIFDQETFFSSDNVPKLPVMMKDGHSTCLRYLPSAVGGLAHFYAGIALRMREREFDRWPFSYADIEPFYSEAEHLMGISGIAGLDPCDPPRSRPYPAPLPEMSAMSKKLKQGAEAMGLRPFPHSLAIQFDQGCRRCKFCNQVPCPYHMKWTPAYFLEQHVALPITLHHSISATRIVWSVDNGKKRIDHIEATDLHSGEPIRIRARSFVLAGGALFTPKLMLQSGLGEDHPLIGTHLMTHCLGLIVGIFPYAVSKSPELEKWWSISDYYFEESGEVRGLIQQDQLTTLKRIMPQIPRFLRPIVQAFYLNTCQLLVIAEDEPQRENRIALVGSSGKMTLDIHHRFTPRDEEKRRFLTRVAKKALRKAGALTAVMKKGQSVYHACGTCRMGTDPAHSVTAPTGKVWHTHNLYVADASLMPTSSGVNPSLSIAAGALRVATFVE